MGCVRVWLDVWCGWVGGQGQVGRLQPNGRQAGTAGQTKGHKGLRRIHRPWLRLCRALAVSHHARGHREALVQLYSRERDDKEGNDASPRLPLSKQVWK